MHPPLLPSFRLRDVDHVVIWFDVAWRDGEQLVDPQPGAPQHPQHKVVARAALMSRREHQIDLLLFKVVGDVLHTRCRKGYLSAITVAILNGIFRSAALCENSRQSGKSSTACG